MDQVRHNDNSATTPNAFPVKRQGLFVLGMHRSGTSAGTRVLNLLGCALSDQLLGAGSGNETGHWESIEAVALNDEMLASAGSTHDDWGPINADWSGSAIRGEMIGRASQVLADHAKLGPLFAIKDPRMCRLADVWLEAAALAGVEPLVLLMLRNPAEVSASLEARDLMASGYSELLWLRYVIDAEYLTRGQKRVISRYDQLMTNWQRVIGKVKDGLGITLPRNTPKVHAEIDGFLSHSQRHHVIDAYAVIDNPAHLEWVRQTFAIMLDWSENNEQPMDYPKLDAIRSELDRSHTTFARFLLTPAQMGEVGSGHKLRTDLEERSTELARIQSALEEARAKLDEECQRRTDAEALVLQRSGELHDTQMRNAQLTGQVLELQSALTQRQEELAQLFSQFLECQQDLNRAETEAEKERALRVQCEQQLESAEAEIRRAAEALNVTEAARGEVESKLTARFNELAQLTSIVASETDRADALEGFSQWLTDLRRVEDRFPRWWAVMPQAWRQQRARQRHHRAGLFDAKAYLALYPDVASEGMEPIRHYILHGRAEGRVRTIPT